MNKKDFFDAMTFPLLMDLHRLRLEAEARKDLQALQILRARLPELFSEACEEVIYNFKEIAFYLDQRYDKNFSSMFEVSAAKEKKIRH